MSCRQSAEMDIMLQVDSEVEDDLNNQHKLNGI